MSHASKSAVCQRCGRGFVATVAYHDFLARRGENVKVPVLCMTCFLASGPMPKNEGEIKWFNDSKRYGFIAGPDGLDVFVHLNQILDNNAHGPYAGRTVRFHQQYSSKGPEAVNVEFV